MSLLTTGGAGSPVSMLKSGLKADTWSSIRVLWWHRVNGNMGCYTGCSGKWHIFPLADVHRLTLKWAIPPPTLTHTHTRTYIHTHLHTNTLPPIPSCSPSPIPLRNKRGLCQSNSIVWVEVMNSSFLSIHLRIKVFICACYQLMLIRNMMIWMRHFWWQTGRKFRLKGCFCNCYFFSHTVFLWKKKLSWRWRHT